MLITRKDGITYERKPKEKKYDTRVTFRMDKKQVELAKTKAEELNIGFYELIREGINYMINKKGD